MQKVLIILDMEKGAGLQVPSAVPSNGRRVIPGFRKSSYSRVSRITEVSAGVWGRFCQLFVLLFWRGAVMPKPCGVEGEPILQSKGWVCVPRESRRLGGRYSSLFREGRISRKAAVVSKKPFNIRTSFLPKKLSPPFLRESNKNQMSF